MQWETSGIWDVATFAWRTLKSAGPISVEMASARHAAHNAAVAIAREESGRGVPRGPAFAPLEVAMAAELRAWGEVLEMATSYLREQEREP